MRPNFYFSGELAEALTDDARVLDLSSPVRALEDYVLAGFPADTAEIRDMNMESYLNKCAAADPGDAFEFPDGILTDKINAYTTAGDVIIGDVTRIIEDVPGVYLMNPTSPSATEDARLRSESVSSGDSLVTLRPAKFAVTPPEIALYSGDGTGLFTNAITMTGAVVSMSDGLKSNDIDAYSGTVVSVNDDLDIGSNSILFGNANDSLTYDDSTNAWKFVSDASSDLGRIEVGKIAVGYRSSNTWGLWSRGFDSINDYTLVGSDAGHTYLNSSGQIHFRDGNTELISIDLVTGYTDMRFQADVPSLAAGTVLMREATSRQIGRTAPKNVTGSRGGNAALANLLTALAGWGLITDSTT